MEELVFHRGFLPAMERWDTKVGFHDGDYHATFAEHEDRVLRVRRPPHSEIPPRVTD